MTVAMSVLIHGEAVRFNRGNSKGDDFDFKYMRGRDGSVFPYVSSQCYKKYWRESLPGPYSPITREKDGSGKEKNQAFTSGNPLDFVDDDLFGYMIAGAAEGDDDDDSPEEPRRVFEAENLKDAEALRARLVDDSPLSKFICQNSEEAKESLLNATSADDLNQILLNLLDETARKVGLVEVDGAKPSGPIRAKFKKAISQEEVRKANREVLLKTFSRELREKPKRATTRRTAPVRMHALVAFSGIRTAKDFQTFSRDIAYTGKNSILNPAVQGIYSGWLKTRILIESGRIGKFYIGENNMDILKEQITDREKYRIDQMPNPYSRSGDLVEYVQLPDSERISRLRAAIRALADIGNKQGPASGALHDGSLRPKAFVAGLLNCADSPFDYIWTSRNDECMPNLDVRLLCENIKDWEDLFATKCIYIGLPAHAERSYLSAVAADLTTDADQRGDSEVKNLIKSELHKIGFEAIVDTPRKALLRLAQEATI